MLDDPDSESTPIFTPKKSNLSRIALAQNAARKSTLAAPDRTRDDEQRPTYTADSLNELKSSTPSTPKELVPVPGSDDIALDLASKFGTDLALRAENGIIPTTAEIEEKKARRKRLAQESEYVSLHPENSDDEAAEDFLERPKNKYGETRLVPEDEDIAEGFDEFVTDGRVALGRKAEREQRRKRKEEIRGMIEEAEGAESGSGDGDDGSDDSEAERNRAYEVAQTRKGMDGLRYPDQSAEGQQRPRTPPRITPLPSLQGCLEKFRERATLLRRQKESRMRRLEEVRREKVDIGEREVEIQRLLKEAGEVYERLRVEAGIAVDGQGLLGDGGGGEGGGMGIGLESLGTTPNRASQSIGSTPLRAEGMTP